jgi:hypothetical protein
MTLMDHPVWRGRTASLEAFTDTRRVTVRGDMARR